MKEAQLEPGLIRVFRWFAWLRMVFLAIIPMIIFRPTFRRDFAIDNALQIIIIVADVLILLLYLYMPGLDKKLGRYYFPVAILIATAALLLEQYFIISSHIVWQQYPFLFVLLILVAWQYRFRNVVFYSIGIALFELVLIFLIPPQTDMGRLIPAEYQPYILLGLLFSRTIIFLVLGYVVTTLMKGQREQRSALAEANQRLIQHAATLEQLSTSRERLRLSRELHDTLAHTLSAMVVQIEALHTVWVPIPEKPREMLGQMLTTSRSGLDETRRALSALRATPLEEMGLALAVSGLAQDTSARCGMALELEVPDNLDDLSPDVEQCYYRVAQEALANISNHAGADMIALKLEHNSKGIKMTITDNGSGFDPNGVKINDHESMFGIKGMQERAELIGAELKIESQPGKGTAVILELEDTR
jgi:signal transduction histidine kinase